MSHTFFLLIHTVESTEKTETGGLPKSGTCSAIGSWAHAVAVLIWTIQWHWVLSCFC